MNEAIVDIENVESVELIRTAIPTDELSRPLSPLGELESHNVVLALQQHAVLTGLYGFQKTLRTLALHVDNAAAFQEALESRCNESLASDL